MRLAERQNLTGLLLGIRRGAIVAVVLLGYLYFRLAGEAYALVAIGLISFAAVAQFAPAAIGGIYWKGGDARAARSPGSRAGFAVWLYTLLLPSFAKSGWLPIGFLEHGPVRHRPPQAVRAVRARGLERHHARDAVEHDRQRRRLRRGVGADAAERGRAGAGGALRRRVPARRRGARRAPVEGHGVAAGPARAARALPRPRARRTPPSPTTRGGAASRRRPRCRRTPASCSSPRPRSPARSAGRRRGSWSRRRSRRTCCRSTKCGRCWTRPRRSSPTATSSKQKSRELIAATAELRAANERLQELDRLKDDFVSTVTHELRTPLTSIRAFSEILHDNPGARCRRAAEIPQHHHPGERAADAPHQPGARSRQAGIGAGRVAGRRRSTSRR